MRAWCNRHINAILLIVWLGAIPIISLLAAYSTDYTPVARMLFTHQIACAITCGWALKKKGHSLQWLWLFLIGLGLIAMVVALRKPTSEPSVTDTDLPGGARVEPRAHHQSLDPEYTAAPFRGSPTRLESGHTENPHR